MSTVKFAISPEIQVGGPMFTPKDMSVIGETVGQDAVIELTSLQQLIVEMSEEKAEEAKQKLLAQGLRVYEVGAVVKNISTCSFCKGAEEEGLEAARALNNAIAGIPVPFTMRVGYTGCPNACGEPLLKDIGVVKRKDRFEIYIGGESKTLEAAAGSLLIDQLTEDELPIYVQKIIEVYKQHGKKREKFGKFVKRFGIENLRKKIGA